MTEAARTLSQTGRTAREQIIEGGDRLLREGGFHDLSMRRVAAACGISVGNLTYHFPTKSDLVAAIVEAVVGRYRERWMDLAKEGRGRRPRAESVVSWLLDDSMEDETGRLFVELWVLAKHSTYGAAAMARFYEAGTSSLAALFADAYPDAGTRRCRQAAYLFLTMTEGQAALCVAGVRPPLGLRPLAVRTVLSVLNGTM